jgi:glycosyltransferase involved in cell wall biosynthesis
MRIGLVIYGNLEILSGNYLYDRKLVDYLKSQGDEVEVVGLPWHGYARNLLQNWSAGLDRRMAEVSADVWLQDELVHPSFFRLNQQLKRKLNAPLVSIVHHLRTSESEHNAVAMPMYRQVERAYLHSLDAFVFNSHTTQQVVEKELGGPARGVVATPGGNRLSGLSLAAVEKRCHMPGPLRLVFVGNLIPRKGLHTLIEGLAQLRPENWVLDVVGRQDIDPDYTRGVKTHIRKYGMENRIRLHGSLPDAKLQQVLSRAQVFIVVSSYEGYGIMYLEGMSFGLPAIASTGGGAHEIVQDGKTGRLVKPGDAAGIATAVHDYCHDRKLLHAHSLGARSAFDTFPTWQQTGKTIRSFLVEISR